MYFTRKYDGISIDEYLEEKKITWYIAWRIWEAYYLKGDAKVWRESLNRDKMKTLSDNEFEQVFLDRWSHAKDNDQTRHPGLFLGEHALLQVQWHIQQENVVVSIYPSCTHNFISIDLEKRLKVPTNKVCSTHLDGENVQVFKNLKITLGNYVLHSDFHARDMDNMDIVLGYPWMKSMGTINLNIEKRFFKLWYKKKKITLQDISLSKPAEPKAVPDIVSIWTLEVTIDTSNDESMVTDTIDDTAAQKDLTQDMHQTTKAAPPKPPVAEVKI